ncbi:hypothetical protein BCR44DRAFT_28701 [Catenaria anguillulae PL171]|uniref:TPR-like protein n=1 Tax=Catenaria anguillulae PL171 TaxID=765915 RepID=A0A1Y2HZH3_9FUNG|nr:hypothetical protein BCR44DRAFT_28701 [Catenaria anguillulae PL171]
MFAARVKSQLKVAKDRLQAKRYQDALVAASDVLDYEPENTTALLFKAAALQNLAVADSNNTNNNDADDSDTSDSDNVDYDLLHQARETLELATKIKPDLAPAWNGLEKVYEKLDDTEALVGALERLLDLFFASGDSKRLTDTLAKLISLHLASSNLALADDSIRLQLPNSRIHSKLTSPPQPIDIWRTLASLHEEHDARTCTQLVAQRRALLGAPPEPIVRAAVEAEVAIAASRRVEAYEHILNISGEENEPEVVSKYLGLLQTQAATGQVPDAAAKMNALVDKCVAAAAPVLVAYQIALDNTDISTVSDYPRALLDPASRISAEADTDRDYALAATWILSGSEPADLSADPSSLFPAVVSSLLSDDDPVILAASRTALALITARKSRAYPKATLALRLRRAQVFVRTLQPHNARSELDAVATMLGDADTLSQLRAEHIRGDAAELLAEPHVAREHYARAVALSTQDSIVLDASATWVRSALAWTDFQLGTLDASDARSALSSIDPAGLAPTLHATHLYRLARVSHATADNAAQAYPHLLAAAQLSPTGVPAIYTLLGRVFATHRRDPARAAKCWAKALALDPADDEAGVLLAEHHVREASDWEKAEKVLAGVTKVKPRAHEAWKRLGLVRMAAEKWEAAVVALQFAVRTMPSSVETEDKREEAGQVWSALGEAYIQLGRWATAVKALTQAHALVPDCPATRYLLAQAHFKLSQFIQAAEYLDNTDSIPCIILAGQVYLHHALSAYQDGRYKECAKLVTEGIEKLESYIGETQSSLLTKALADLRTAWSAVPHHCPDLAHQLEQAATEYASVGLYGESGAAYVRLAQLCPDATHAVTHAESNLTRAITSTPPAILRDSPYLSPVWTALGTVYAMQHLPRRAQHCFILALRGNPTSPAVWTNLAALYIAQGDTPLAVEALERAVAADAEHPDPWVLRAVAAAADGALHLAAAHVTHAVTSGLWTSPLLAQAVAESATLRESDQHAIDVQVAAIKWSEYHPTDPASWTAVACAYERQGNMRDAVAAMKQAVKLDRNNLGLVGNLARMLAGSDPARAVDLLKRVPGGGWPKSLVLACAEHASLGAATDAVLNTCLEEMTAGGAPQDAKHLLAQLLYKAGAPVDRIEPLVAHSAPGILCALGMLAGDETLVAAGFARAAPAEAQYLASIHHVLQGDLATAQRALERAVHEYPGDVAALARLARFLARYSPNRAQVAIAEEVVRREMTSGDPTAALGMAATGLLAVGGDVKEAIKMAQRQVMARPSAVKAWKQLGVAVLAANTEAHDAGNSQAQAAASSKLVAHLASYPLSVDPDSPFSHLLASAGALALGDPAQAMQNVEQAVALISASAGADALPGVVYRQIARVLLSNGESDAGLDMLKRALEAPVGADTVSQAVRASAVLDLAALYAQVGWTQEAQALVVDSAENDEHLPLSAKAVLLAYASALAGLDLDAVQRAVAVYKDLVGGGVGDGEGSDLSHPLLEQAGGLLALATFKAGSKGKGAKLMASVKRSDMLQVFSAMGGTILTA